MKQSTKLFSKHSILVILILIISSCTLDDDNIAFSNADPLLLEVGYDPENIEYLEISCPVGVICDENFTYRAYSFNNSELYFYISFNPGIIDNYSLESLRENFNYLDFRIYFPERNTANSEFYYSNRTPIWELNQPTDNNLEFTIDSYENGNMKGVIKGTITEITEFIQSDSPDCITDDMMGICYKYEEANIPFTVNYNFRIE